MNNLKVFVFGQRNIKKGYDANYILFEFDKIVSKAKSENNSVFVYSGLQEGAELLVASHSISSSISVIGCVPFKNFEYKFHPINQKIYRHVVARLQSFNVMSSGYSYKAYAIRLEYMKTQCNCGLCIWNEKEGHTKILLKSLMRSWKNKKYPIYIINYQNHSATLVST
jgi:hypothetical protein